MHSSTFHCPPIIYLILSPTFGVRVFRTLPVIIMLPAGIVLPCEVIRFITQASDSKGSESIKFAQILCSEFQNKVAFVLNPLEIKSGSCKYNPVKLKLFKSENKSKKYNPSQNFSLNNISTIEIY